MRDVMPPLIDAHAHFHTPHTGRSDWQRYNQSRLDAGERIGIRCHVASVLGSWGHTSPTYFPSPDDQTRANDWMLEFANTQSNVRAYVAVNPNHTDHALREIERGVRAGAIGIKLAASRRADDAQVDAVAEAAAQYNVPILHHIWQHRRRDWPNQDASDAIELGRLARRHPRARFLLAHIGGGGDWAHTFPAVRGIDNIWMDLSGSGIDRGMLDEAILGVGADRLLWAADLTICTGLTKLLALAHVGLDQGAIEDICWGNAVRLFLPGAFDTMLSSSKSAQSSGVAS
jgi:uncharacterized protein